MGRRLVVVLVTIACAAGVIAYQATRPARTPADPRVFVPSPQFFSDFSPSFRTSVADAYYLAMIQYYGEHVAGDGRLDSLPQMIDLVTDLSPRFTRTYVFGAFALVDAGRPDLSYAVLEKGFKANPDEWMFPSYLGYFAYQYGQSEDKHLVGAEWYERAAAIEGSPDYLRRLAAALLAKGGEQRKAVLMLGQAYLAGDEYAREKAVAGLEYILPRQKEARMRALAPLYDTMPKDDCDALIADLFEGYVQ